MDYQYFYALWTLLFLLLWLFLFLRRKDTRREMLTISIFFGFAGLLSQSLHLHDWWQPLRITNTPLGFEDFFIGFAIGGIAAVIYEAVFRKRVVHSSSRYQLRRSSYLFIIIFGALFLGFFIAGFNSGYSALFAYLISIFYMLGRRRDLVYNSVLSGGLLLLIGTGMYYVLFLFYPDYIDRFWYLPDVWYSTLILGVPLGEYVWYFLTGVFIGPLYEFIEGLGIRRVAGR